MFAGLFLLAAVNYDGKCSGFADGEWRCPMTGFLGCCGFFLMIVGAPLAFTHLISSR